MSRAGNNSVGGIYAARTVNSDISTIMFSAYLETCPNRSGPQLWRIPQAAARPYCSRPRARTLRPNLGCPTSYRVDERSRFRRRPAQRRPRWISAPRCVIGAMTPTLRRWLPHRSTVPTLPMRWGPPVSEDATSRPSALSPVSAAPCSTAFASPQGGVEQRRDQLREAGVIEDPREAVVRRGCR